MSISLSVMDFEDNASLSHFSICILYLYLVQKIVCNMSISLSVMDFEDSASLSHYKLGYIRNLHGSARRVHHYILQLPMCKFNQRGDNNLINYILCCNIRLIELQCTLF